MNRTIPDTRNSLILRLRDARDVAAWDRFVAIYQPLVYRLARAKGLQDADAQDVVQEVMVAVSRAIERWEPNAQRGRFRDWLFRIARNLVINFLTRRKHRPLSPGGIDVDRLLNEQCALDSDLSREFDREYQRELLRFAGESVRQDVRPRTWDAFRLTYIDRRSVDEAAAALGMTVGAVQVARCRVLARLREMVKAIENSET